jgi:hypothetical protein
MKRLRNIFSNDKHRLDPFALCLCFAAAIFDFFTAMPEKRLPISLNFLYVLVARIKLDQPETDDVLDRAIDYRAVIATAAIEVMVELR